MPIAHSEIAVRGLVDDDSRGLEERRRGVEDRGAGDEGDASGSNARWECQTDVSPLPTRGFSGGLIS